VKIGLDVDGVVCNFITNIVDINNQFFSKKSYEDIVDFDLSKCFGVAEYKKILQTFIERDSCLDLPLYPGALYMYNELRTIGEVIFVTAPLYSYPNWCEQRFAWLKKNFSADKEHVIFTSNKNIADVDVLVDDAAHNLERWKKKNKPSIKISRPWNKHYQHVLSADNEEDVIRHIKNLK
jgi:5'(3')-deoxyribonucleotidase